MDIFWLRLFHPFKPDTLAFRPATRDVPRKPRKPAPAPKVEVMSWPFEEGGKVYVMARETPGDPTSLVRIETSNLFLMLVSCRREGSRFYVNPRPYPAGRSYPIGRTGGIGKMVQITNYNRDGDIFIDCPTCGRGYFYYNGGDVIADLLPQEPREGWHSDRPLDIIENLTDYK